MSAAMTPPPSPCGASPLDTAVADSTGAALPPVEAVDALATDALPAFIAYAAALQVRAAMRLSGVAPSRGAEGGAAPAAPTLPGAQSDRLLNAQDVAALLNAKPAWVYRHQRQLGGEKLDGLLRFSARRVLSYLERQRRAAA